MLPPPNALRPVLISLVLRHCQFLQQSIDIRTPLPIDQFEHQLVKELSEKLEELQYSVGFYAYQRPHLLIAEPPKGYSVLDVVSEEVLEGLCN